MERQATILAALAVVVVMNTASFLPMGCERQLARQGRRRVPEKASFLVTACFGGPGGVPGIKGFSIGEALAPAVCAATGLVVRYT